MEILIRSGEEKDLPAVMELIRELAGFERAPEAVTNSAERMVKEQPYFRFEVAEKDGGIIGMALWFFAYFTWVGKSLYLDDIYVKPAFRGQKIGTRLLRRVFGIARAEGCQRLRWQVLDWNEHAIRLYKRAGARISSEWLNCDFLEADIITFLEENQDSE